MLLQFAKFLGHEGVTEGFYGQEINGTTYNLARINMLLHGVGYENFNIAHADTLENPAHWDEQPFDAIVSNPPYSIPWAGDNDPTLINDERFAPAGVLAPKGYADLAFTMHILRWLSTDGTAAIVSFPGVLYRSGAEQKIRQYLVDNNYVEAVIQLPPDLFFGTGIATDIMVLKKNKATNDVLFVDGSKEFYRENAKNHLSEENIAHILDLYENRENVQYQAIVVPAAEIAAKDYNLTPTSYVEREDTREKINIVELNARAEEIVGRQTLNRDIVLADIADMEAGA